jgi:hypothetical protein
MIIFHLIFKMLKNSILNIEWTKIEKKNSTCTKCPIFQNGLHVNEILIFKNQLSGTLKDTYLLSNYGCYNYNISNF